jgi:hypothetical protein
MMVIGSNALVLEPLVREILDFLNQGRIGAPEFGIESDRPFALR